MKKLKVGEKGMEQMAKDEECLETGVLACNPELKEALEYANKSDKGDKSIKASCDIETHDDLSCGTGSFCPSFRLSWPPCFRPLCRWACLSVFLVLAPCP